MTTLRKLSLLLPAAALSTGLASHAAAQDQYEWEPGTGTHEEEWYDPTDWFDDDADAEYGSSVDYEETGNDYGFDTTYDDDYDSYDGTTYGYTDEYGYDAEDYNNSVGYTDEYGYDAEDYRQRNNNNAGMTRNRMNNRGTDDGYLLYFYETRGENQQQNRQMQQDRQAQGQQDRQRRMQQDRQAQGQQDRQRQMQQDRQAQGQQDRQRQAQQDRPQRQGQQGRQAMSPEASVGQGDWGQRQVIEGRLTSLTDVKLQGVADSHRLVKVRRDSGREVVVDLGKSKDFADFDLEKHDYVIVFGETGKINNQKVIFARHVAELNTIDRSDRADRARRGGQGSQQSRR